MADFVHLHVHTQYSLLDGALKIPDLMKRVKETGMSAVAMTDHGNMYGAVDFQKAASKKGVKSIIGCEMYFTKEAYDLPAEDKTELKSYHLTMLAMNLQGYKNLMFLNSMAWLHGVHPRTGIPRIDFELFSQHHEGIIVLSGDLGGEINQALLWGNRDEAREIAIKFRDLLGPDRYYLEVMRNAFPEQERCNEAMFAFSEELGIPLVATNDCHYLDREDAKAHAVLMSIQLSKTVDLERLMEHQVDQLYVRSPEEMYEAFSDHPEACANTVKIAEMCDLTIPLGQVYLPKYDVPESFEVPADLSIPPKLLEKLEQNNTELSPQDVRIHAYFEHVSREGLKERFEEFDKKGIEYDRAEYEERLEIEIGIIREMDFPGYFLIVWDFIAWSKQEGIPVGPGRGSGAGSLVAYALRITNIDPLPYDLLFERFLNPERVSMPDFDIDFCMNRRGEVIQYVTEKYGADNVGQIITYGQLKAKAVVRDVGRALGLKYGETDRLAKLVPDVLGISLSEALDQEPRLRQMRQEDETIDALFDIALSLENLNRQAGMHAAGVVISEDPLWEYVPICRGANDEIVTQFAKNEVEEAGLVKFDFLGLKTLTVIETAMKIINEQRSAKGEEPFDIETIPLDDRGVYKMISAGDTTGVFQLESSGFQELLKKLKPDCFEDIVAAVALYRPGPLGTGMVDDFIDRKHGRKRVEYPHPWLEEVLKPTYGVMVYQEQVMQTARVMAGYSLGGADLLRRAMGKKIPAKMAAQKEIFIKGATELEVPEAKSTEIFDLMAYFAGYGFNKCVVGSTEVIDARTGARTTVKALFDARENLDFSIHAIDDNGQIQNRDVTDVVWNGLKPVYELTTKQGKKITATGNHPFLTLEGWVNLEDLSLGDLIGAPRKLDVSSTKTWPEHELIVLGGLLSEGNTCHPSCLYFYNNDEDAIQDFVDAATCFEHSVARVSTRDKGRMEVCVSTGRDTRFQSGQIPWNATGQTAVELEAPSRSGMYHWAESLGILDKRADEKVIPAEVFELCDDDLALLLGRLWSGDGFFANATQAVPFYATSSEQLAKDVQHVLLRLGILSGVHEKTFKYRGGERTGYTVHIVGDGMRERFIEVIVPHTVGRDDAITHLKRQVEASKGGTSKDTIPASIRDQIKELKSREGLTWKQFEERAGISCREFMGKGGAGKRGFRRETIARIGDAFNDANIQAIATSDIFWDEIVSIEAKGVEHTFDLTVDIDHNFVANDLFVHNSHSAAYALITYQTGFLKTHFEVEFMAALMTNDRDNTDKVVRFINEAKEMNIEVLPPDVNESLLDFSVTDGKIRFGLAAIKGVGAGVIEVIIEAREDGPFKSLYDFCARVDLKKANKRTIEALVKCGAFDSVGPAAGSTYIGDHCEARARMFAAIPMAVDRGQKAQHDKAVGQSSLFGMLAPAVRDEALEDTYPEVEAWSDRELLSLERTLIGFYVTGHPLDRFDDEISLYGVTSTSDITYCRGLRHRDEVTVAGVVSEYRERPLKSGNGRMAFLKIEDKNGQCEVLVFSSAFAANEEALKCNEPILIKGQYTEQGDLDARVGKVRAAEVTRLLEARKRYVRKVTVDIQASELTNGELTRVKSALKEHPGDCRTVLILEVDHEYGRGRAEMALPEEFWVEPTDGLLTSLERIFRRKVVRLSSN